MEQKKKEKKMRTLVSFDWYIKKLLRNKANYEIVEGLLTVLLEKKITITGLLESESNKEEADDKYNRVDFLAESEDHELMIFEIQNDSELDYFHRVNYGTSKTISEYLKSGNDYDRLRKVYSINIVYFDLGQGSDYVYRGRTEFRSLHHPDEVLNLSAKQKQAYHCETPADIFPEYFILKVNQFDKVATTPLDEWISFLKTTEIPLTATAPGLQEARNVLRYDNLTPREREIYDGEIKLQRIRRAEMKTKYIEGLWDGEEKGEARGLAKGRAEERAKAYQEKLESARKLKQLGVAPEIISQAHNLSIEEVNNL